MVRQSGKSEGEEGWKIYDTRKPASIKGLRVDGGFLVSKIQLVAHALLIAQAAKKS